MSDGAGPAVLFDVNVLVALALDTHQHHRAAHRALRDHPGRWLTTPTTEAGLLRLLLNPTVTGRSFRAVDVLAVLRGMRAHPRWRFLPDEASLAEAVVDLSGLMGHRQVTDLHLLNLAAATGSMLGTFDGRLKAELAPRDRRNVWLVPTL